MGRSRSIWASIFNRSLQNRWVKDVAMRSRYTLADETICASAEMFLRDFYDQGVHPRQVAP